MKHDSHQPNVPKDQAIEDLTNSTSEADLFSKEVIMLASGLLLLTLGIGGVLMYSEDEPLHANATKAVDMKQVSKAFHSPTPAGVLDQETDIQPPTATFVSYENEGSPSEETLSSDQVDVYFSFDQTALSDEAKNILQETAVRYGQEQDWGATIQGSTDSKGSASYNHALALRRAQSVKNYLMTLGAQEPSIQIESLRSGNSVCTEDVEECHQQNRRAHVIFTKTESTPTPEVPLISETVPTESENIMTAEPSALTPSHSEEDSATTMALLDQPTKDGDPIATHTLADPLP